MHAFRWRVSIDVSYYNDMIVHSPYTNYIIIIIVIYTISDNIVLAPSNAYYYNALLGQKKKRNYLLFTTDVYITRLFFLFVPIHVIRVRSEIRK